MFIKYAIMGFLSELPLTGYDLKKKFSESEIVYWSGNNNQIYRSLVELHEEQFVTVEIQYQDNKPPRKIYTITAKGLSALHYWMLTMPELVQLRSELLVHLNWADQLDPHELDKMLTLYEEETQIHLMMLKEQSRRKNIQSVLRNRIAEHWLAFYVLELDWVREIRRELTIG